MNTFIIALFALIAGASAAAVREQEKFVPIVSQVQEVNPDGSFKSAYESADGTIQQSQGGLINAGQKDEAQVIEGSATWTSPEGIPIALKWIAGPNGVEFQGEHLPTSPPAQEIPLAIQRSLEWNAAHPEEDVKPKP
ncbi:endocuticle structural glycoprotein SgAbd-2-like [Neodiprion virginianus]|uniref:endocuticle structural glycoprotein SgAbd-2-like n=1 Tax=Neodiprion virginianus TaxID=2961670 RepID=UPI001EE722A4|nr:endocuticle structural glycoprotein SgAbd-2-like [Neodiprion virginianus]